MAAYRHCPGCGRAFDQKSWQKESFCGSCGEPLKTALRRDEPQEIHPYPNREPVRKFRAHLYEIIAEIERLLRAHPIIGVLTLVGGGAGCIAAAPVLMTLATGLAWIGGIITFCSFLLAGYDDKRRAAGKGMAWGLVLLAGALVLVVASHLLVALGIAGVAGGVITSGKGTVEAILRRRIESQLKEKSITELIDLSRQLT